LLPEGSAADPEDSLLNTDDEFPSAQVQRPTDKQKERQDKQPPKPPKSPKKRRRDTLRGSYEQPPKKRPRQFQPESEESISKLKAHSEKGLCVTTQGPILRPMKNLKETLP